jgi:hypothetical protein
MNYAEYPTQLGEIRSDRSGSARDRSPRETLIESLRRLDNGTEQPQALIVISTWMEDGERVCIWNTSSPDTLITYGMVTRVLKAL